MVEWDTHLRTFMAAKLMPDEFGKSPSSDDPRERAAVACALLREMRDSVPLWVGDGDEE